jgi:hypothetical protein
MPLGDRDLLAQHRLLPHGKGRQHPLADRALHPAADRPADEPRGRAQDHVGDTILQ